MSETKRVIARDCTALIDWAVTLVIAAAMVMATRAVLHGLEPRAWQWGAIAIAWGVTGLFLAAALREPCTTAVLGQDGTVTFSWRYPHKRRCKSGPAAELAAPVVSRSVDSDGDSNHSARLTLPDGSDFVLRHSVVQSGSAKSQDRNRQRCEAACARFSAALSQSVT